MIPDWETNCVLIASALARRHPTVYDELRKILSAHGVPLREIEGNRDIWIRDAAPVQVGDGDFLQFCYWPDYLRDGHEHLITGPETFTGLPFIKSLERSDLVLDGGNIVGTAGTAILTEKVFRENPDRSRSEVEDEVRRLLRVERLIFIPKEPYDPIGHADGLVRFIDDATVVLNDYSVIDPKLGERLHEVLEQHGLKVELLPYRPERRRFDGIESAVGNFVNYLRVGDLIILPSYRIPEDGIARERLGRLCPEAAVVSLRCPKLAREGGVLQCVSWTVRVPKKAKTRRRVV